LVHAVAVDAGGHVGVAVAEEGRPMRAALVSIHDRRVAARAGLGDGRPGPRKQSSLVGVGQPVSSMRAVAVRPHGPLSLAGREQGDVAAVREALDLVLVAVRAGLDPGARVGAGALRLDPGVWIALVIRVAGRALEPGRPVYRGGPGLRVERGGSRLPARER